jgi:hypothetical protein
MSERTFDFEATNTGMENGKFKVTLLPTGDFRFLKYAFHFQNIDLSFDEAGIGVEYDLVVDIASEQLPDTLSPERQTEIKEFGHNLLQNFMNNLLSIVETVADSDLDTLSNLQYNPDKCADICSDNCSGECHENF